MLDKSVPYKGILMRRLAGKFIPSAVLPQGYSFSLYRPGDEIHWARIETSRRDPCIHFVGVRADRQGIGLGKAIIYEGLRFAVEIEGDRDIYLSTSTWCHKAIGIYIKAGFEIYDGDFGGYTNYCAEALEIMRGLDLPYKI